MDINSTDAPASYQRASMLIAVVFLSPQQDSVNTEKQLLAPEYPYLTNTSG